MKKILSLLLSLLLLAGVVFICKRTATDCFFSANVEALARSEGGLFGPMCSKTGTKGKYYMKLCSNCSGSYGHYAMDIVAYCPNK